MRTFVCAVSFVILAIVVGCGGCNSNSSTPSVSSSGATLVVTLGKVQSDKSSLNRLPDANGVTVFQMGDEIAPMVYDSKIGYPGGMVQSWSIVCPDGHTMQQNSDYTLFAEYVGNYIFVADYKIGDKIYHPQAKLRIDPPK
ncbi:MAG: hypothetical protein US94_C0019G0005 [Berkelbacteria bacterium GW2011_GWB1_38_5]|uniref:Lipoprotein n=1 Tax=Berkelbacteria bacterium GW2011_GWB1_38_5 TaxID=1618336 RepID=A0A0G0MJM6_9BACT|nr:MAG: hypothetical protein US94_C0019G0005 [Berkelbacteria bacterium GW2011_GWB1_38_5]